MINSSGTMVSKAGEATAILVLPQALAQTIKMLVSTIGTKIGGLRAEVTKDATSVRVIRPFVQAMPDWIWQLLTWTPFFLGYLIKAAVTVQNLVFFFLWYVSAGSFFDALSLMLLLRPIADQAVTICHADFKAFIDLGPGGTPSTWNGFKRITLNAWFGRINVLKPPKHNMGSGFLSSMPQREGMRPVVAGIAPQRQLDQRNSPEVFDYLLTNLDHFAAENNSHLRKATSFLEKRTEAIFAHCDCVNHPLFRTFGCEIMHPHHIDGSLHVVLHPEDIRTVIEAGWAERHPIARADSWWTWWFFTTEGRPPVPEHLCFIYAPRTYEEVCIVMMIVEAGAWYVAGEGKVHADGHMNCPNHYPRKEKAWDAIASQVPLSQS